MTRKSLVMLMAVIGLVSFATAQTASDEKNAKEMKSLAGSWEFVKLAERGDESSGKDVSMLMLTIEGDKMIFCNGGKERSRWSFKIDCSCTPKCIDLKGDKTKLSEGIYELKGAELRICFSPEGGQDRPLSFATGEDKPYRLLVLNRRKD